MHGPTADGMDDMSEGVQAPPCKWWRPRARIRGGGGPHLCFRRRQRAPRDRSDPLMFTFLTCHVEPSRSCSSRGPCALEHWWQHVMGARLPRFLIERPAVIGPLTSLTTLTCSPSPSPSPAPLPPTVPLTLRHSARRTASELSGPPPHPTTLRRRH